MKNCFLPKNIHFQILILLVIVSLAYSNIFANQLIIDNKPFILKWETIRSLNNIPKFFVGDVPQGHEGVYRPIRGVLYALVYSFSGTNPLGYHLLSLSIHLTTVTFGFLLIDRLTKKRYLAFVGALLYGLHPINTEAITYITASVEMAGVSFLMISLYFYLQNKQLSLSLSIIAAALAFFTYEVSLMLIPLVVLYDLIFLKPRVRDLGGRFKVYLPYFAVAAVYIFVRVVVLGIGGRGDYAVGSFYLTLLATFKVLAKYISLAVLPIHQAQSHLVSQGIEAVLYRGYSQDKLLAQSITDGNILLSIAVIIILLAVMVYLWRRLPLVSFGVGWFFISLLPADNLIPQYSLMHEKFMYLPAFGFILVLIGVLDALLKRKSYLWLIALVIAAGYFVLTFERNMVWRDEKSLWGRDTQTYPNQNAYAHFQLGNAYWDAGEIDQSIEQYNKASSINPHFAVALGSVARSYQKKGNLQGAIEYYLRSTQVDPKFWEGYINLADIYLSQGQKDLAAKEYKKLHEVYPEFELAQERLTLHYSGSEFSFDYPESWNKVNRDGLVVVGTAGFQIELSLDSRSSKVSIDQYLSSQMTLYGTLVNQGSAQVPNTDAAYVRIFKDHGIQKNQFFLFKADKVVKILVYPADSPLMKVFDQIVESIKVNS